MVGRILVALRLSDRLEHVLPYLETIARSDAKVVFLVHYNAGGLKKYLDMLLPGNKSFQPECVFGSGQEKEPKEEWRQLAREDISAAYKALSRVGARIEVAVYAGGLRKAVSKYMGKGDVQVIVVPGRRSYWLIRLLRNIFSTHQPFELPTLPPVILFRADNARQV